MKKKYLYIVFLAFIFSCNNLSNDFFEFLFNSKGINLNRECFDNPPLFSEGRTFEIYSIKDVNMSLLTENILDKSKFVKSNKYPRYDIPEWHKTSINLNDSVYAFIHSEMKDKKNACFDENGLMKVLQQEENYYTFLYDDLGKTKLFILDTKSHKLFLLTSYEL